MSYFKHFIIITIFLISIKAATFPILKKYGKVENTNGKVIFESKDFSEGDDMHFKIKTNGNFIFKELQFRYFSNIEDITYSSSTRYSESYKSSSTTSVNGRVTSTLYFTIKKKSEDYSDSNGNYLLLEINSFNFVDFENTEKDGSKSIIIIVIIVLVVSLVVIGVIIGLCCYCIRKRARMRAAYINPTPMIMYGAPQPMYPQQGNMVYMYGGQQVMVQPNGIPYNNPNIQYSNIPNNNPSGLAAQNNAVPQQNYNMIPQSSAERGYNSNTVNEKVMK
jgi:hypothetical protein